MPKNKKTWKIKLTPMARAAAIGTALGLTASLHFTRQARRESNRAHEQFVAFRTSRSSAEAEGHLQNVKKAYTIKNIYRGLSLASPLVGMGVGGGVHALRKRSRKRRAGRTQHRR